MQRTALGAIDVNSVLGSPGPNAGIKAPHLEQTPKNVGRRGRRVGKHNCDEERPQQLLALEDLEELHELEKGFIPREARTPFLKRKIRGFESESAPLELKRPTCRLEREKLQATQANAASVVNEVFWEPFFHSLLVREGLALPKHSNSGGTAAASAAAAAEAAGLGSLPVHKGKLELMRDAAAASAAQRRKEAGASASASAPDPSVWSPVQKRSRGGRTGTSAATDSAAATAAGRGGGLSDLKIHKSGLELAKEAAVQAALEAAQQGGSADPHHPASARTRAEQAVAPAAGGLGDLKIHKCRLEREKDAALAAAAAAAAAAASASASSGEAAQRHPRAGNSSAAAGAGAATGWGSGLEDMKVHKSGLERAKEDFTREHPGGAAPRPTKAKARAADEWALWDGLPLDACTKPHQSKLEKTQAAWKAAAAAHEAGKKRGRDSGR